jgi:hypothetical protein
VHKIKLKILFLSFVAVMFGYVHVYRKGGQYDGRQPRKAERQALVQQLQALDKSYSDDWSQN